MTRHGGTCSIELKVRPSRRHQILRVRTDPAGGCSTRQILRDSQHLVNARAMALAEAEALGQAEYVTTWPDPAAYPLHLRMTNGEVYQLRYDPASAWPDFVYTQMGPAHHHLETGHPAARGCCDKVDANGRHLLPQHRPGAAIKPPLEQSEPSQGGEHGDEASVEARPPVARP